MQTDHVRFRKQFGQFRHSHERLSRRASAPAVGEHVHPQRVRDRRDRPAYLAVSYYAHRLAAKFDRLAQPIAKIGAPAPIAPPHAVDVFADPPRMRQQQRERVLRDAHRRVGRHVCHRDPEPVRRRKIDDVVARRKQTDIFDGRQRAQNVGGQFDLVVDQHVRAHCALHDLARRRAGEDLDLAYRAKRVPIEVAGVGAVAVQNDNFDVFHINIIASRARFVTPTARRFTPKSPSSPSFCRAKTRFPPSPCQSPLWSRSDRRIRTSASEAPPLPMYARTDCAHICRWKTPWR